MLQMNRLTRNSYLKTADVFFLIKKGSFFSRMIIVRNIISTRTVGVGELLL